MAEKQRDGSVLVVIGAFKLLKAALLFAIALGIRRLLSEDVGDALLRWAHAVRVDPENRFIHGLIARITGLSHRQLQEIRLGTLLYALMFATEGVGLLLRQRWAEWFTVVTTGALLPLEAYEVVRRFRWPRLVVLVLNLAILGYLVWQIRRTRRRPPVT
jgi:uncharacterized membrane protein (DUF2068 family)